jgi:hypothetical protein
MKRYTVLVILGLALAFEPAPTLAQVRAQGGQRQQLERRLQQGFGRLVQTELGLNAEQIAPLQAIMQSFRGDRQAVYQAQAVLRYRLRDPSLAEVSDESAREVLGEMIRVQEAELDLYRREQAELLTVLTPNQLVRFYKIRDDWGKRIQDLRRPRGPGGPGGRPAGPPGSGGGRRPF